LADPVPFRVDHLAVLVNSIDASVDYYRDRLGMAVVADERVPEAGVRLMYLDAGGVMLQLVEPTAPGPLRAHLDERGEGLHHICYAVPRIEEAIQRLAPGAAPRILVGGRGRRTAFLPTTFNAVTTELTEIEPYRPEGA
jgi:methylmalonyl-CoA epimerase